MYQIEKKSASEFVIDGVEYIRKDAMWASEIAEPGSIIGTKYPAGSCNVFTYKVVCFFISDKKYTILISTDGECSRWTEPLPYGCTYQELIGEKYIDTFFPVEVK